MTGDNYSGEFVTHKDVLKTKQPSFDTSDSTSSLFSSGEHQLSKICPSPGTYVVELPKDQIYRVPPPENAHRYEYLSRRKPNRPSNSRRCICYFLASLLVLLFLAAIVAGILYLVYKPHKPIFAVSGFSVAGINLNSSAPLSPVIGIKLRSNNVNGKLGLIYEEGAAAEVFYGGIKLGNGEFTAFKQPAENVTVIVTALKGSRIQLTSSSRKELTALEKKGKVPFDLRVKAPVKFNVGAVNTWTMTVTVDCEISVDKLTASASVMTENCETGLSVF
ncbi:unnamed protein product [Cochlearia groenlandica]